MFDIKLINGHPYPAAASSERCEKAATIEENTESDTFSPCHFLENDTNKQGKIVSRNIPLD